MNFIRPIQNELKEKYPNVDFYVTGGVPLTMAFTEVSISDMATLTPLMLLVIFLVAGLSLRSVLGIYNNSFYCNSFRYWHDGSCWLDEVYFKRCYF